MTSPKERLDALAAACSTRVDEATLQRFAALTTGSDFQQPDRETAAAAGCFLFDLIETAKRGEDLNSYLNQTIGVKKRRANLFDPATASLDHPAFVVVMRYAAEELQHKDAKREFAELVPASDKQIERYMAALEPRAKRALQFVAKLKNALKS
jgi:hypothetical protein